MATKSARRRRNAREDSEDIESVRRSLAEIAADPSRLIGGEELRIRLKALLEDDDEGGPDVAR
jgi:hypothetical protein